jgi:hypothetical protein
MIFNRAEAIREAGAVFEGEELAFRMRIVIRDGRSAGRVQFPAGGSHFFLSAAHRLWCTRITAVGVGLVVGERSAPARFLSGSILLHGYLRKLCRRLLEDRK